MPARGSRGAAGGDGADASAGPGAAGGSGADGGGRGWLRDAALIARVDLRCTLRRLREHPRTFVGRSAILALAWLSFFGSQGAVVPSSAPSPAGLRLSAAGLWLFVAATVAMSAPRSLDDVTAGPELVLSAGVRATVVGTLAVTAVESATVFAAFVGTGVLRVAAAAADPPLAVALGAVAVSVGLASALAAGFAAGVAFHPATRRVPVLNRRPRAAFVPVLLAVVLALLRPDLLGPALRALPMAALGDVLALGVGAGDPVVAAVGVVGAALSVPVFVLLAERAALTAWFDGDDGGAGGSTRGRRVVGGVVGLTAPVASRPTRAVATRAWLRMLRNPRTLFQLAIPAFTLGAVLVQRPTELDGFVPVFVAALAGISAGLTLTLNPLALEGDALPAMLTTPAGGGRVVRGYALAGVLAAAPALVVLVVPLAALTGLGVAVTALALAWGALVAVVGAVASSAIGFLVPSTGAAAGGETQAPTQAAVIAYTFVGFVTAAPGMAGLLALDTAGGVAFFLGDVALLAVVGGVSYVYVVRRYRGLTVDAA